MFPVFFLLVLSILGITKRFTGQTRDWLSLDSKDRFQTGCEARPSQRLMCPMPRSDYLPFWRIDVKHTLVTPPFPTCINWHIGK